MAERGYDECHWFHYDTYKDLCFFEVGKYVCPPQYGYGPIIRDTYILHYIFKGQGKLSYHNRTYFIGQNQIFVIPAGEVAYYEADAVNPWEYSWIRFQGPVAKDLLKRAGITDQSPVYTPMGSTVRMEEILKYLLENYTREFDCIGHLYLFLQELIDHSDIFSIEITDENSLPDTYVKRVTKYIEQKYADPISATQIAMDCGLDRSYLSRIFKASKGISLQMYIQQVRIKKAMELLKEKDFSVAHTAYSVGYSDPFTFSKFFKKNTGMTPTEYKKGI